MISDTLADRLQVWGFESDCIIFNDGSLGFGIDLIPIDVSCWKDDSTNSLAERTMQVLNGLPSNTDLQFIQEIGAGNSEIVAAHQALVDGKSGKMAQALCAARADRILDLDAQGLVPRHRLKLFVRRPMNGPLIDKQGLLNALWAKPNLFPTTTEETLKREISAFCVFRNELSQNLRSLGISTNLIDTHQVVNILYRQWNPSRKVELAHYDPEDMRNSILFTDTVLNEKGFSLADTHYRILSLKILPEQTFASMATVLRELPFDSQLFLTIHVPDQQKELQSLQTQRRLAYSMARGKTSGVSDIESEAKFQDIETLLSELISQGEKVFQVSLNIVLKSKSQDELEAQVSQSLTKVRELSGAEAMEESLAAFDIFTEIAIPNARARERIKRMKTSTLADLIPLFGPWPGHDRPSILLRSRMGSLVRFDPFSQDLSNYNHVVSGGSGSGKSFLTNVLLLQMLKETPKIFIVDIGGSYKKLCDNLGGQYIPLTVGSGMTVNPFDLLPNETVPSSQKIKFLTGLIELMTKEEDEARLPRLERAEIEEAIQKTYEVTREGQVPRLSVLREILLDHSDVTIRRYGRILTPWCGNTPYGQFVDSTTTIEFEKPIVAFDLKGMESYPDLQSVCLFIITDFIWREIQKDRSSKKFLVFDECWKLLENEGGANFIGEVFRTFRKYYAAAIAISQNMDDFAKSKVAGAILSNSSIKWCLTQKGADQARLQEILQLNDNEMALISSLHQERGVYSEAFLMAQDQRAVVAIESTPLEYWIATTDPRDLAKIEAETLKNPEKDSLSTLLLLSKQYPKGTAATPVTSTDSQRG
ncbi:MAG: ATP-binding protein [Bdellovibrio sp.]|nr:ATP-binding protein [Bdellovibrio sp.]